MPRPQLRLPLRRHIKQEPTLEGLVPTTEAGKLRRWRLHKLGWTRVALASKLGYSERTIHHYEQGQINGKPISATAWKRFKARCAQVARKSTRVFDW